MVTVAGGFVSRGALDLTLAHIDDAALGLAGSTVDARGQHCRIVTTCLHNVYPHIEVPEHTQRSAVMYINYNGPFVECLMLGSHSLNRLCDLPPTGHRTKYGRKLVITLYT